MEAIDRLIKVLGDDAWVVIRKSAKEDEWKVQAGGVGGHTGDDVVADSFDVAVDRAYTAVRKRQAEMAAYDIVARSLMDSDDIEGDARRMVAAVKRNPVLG